MNINNVVLAGRLAKDPELRYTPNGAGVATLTIAVNRSFTNQQGEREADFIQCVAWNKTAENISNYFNKGSEIGIIGRIQTRSFENSEGKRVYVTEIIVESFSFGAKSNGNGQGNSNTAGGHQNANKGQQGRNNDDPFRNDGKPIDISDDDLPF